MMIYICIILFYLDCYVVDEIIILRVGVRVWVGNIDVEGRMVMVDVFCYFKE